MCTFLWMSVCPSQLLFLSSTSVEAECIEVFRNLTLETWNSSCVQGRIFDDVIEEVGAFLGSPYMLYIQPQVSL